MFERERAAEFAYIEKRSDRDPMDLVILDTLWSSPDAMREALHNCTPTFVHGPTGGHWVYVMETMCGQIIMDQALFLRYQNRYTQQMLPNPTEFLKILEEDA